MNTKETTQQDSSIDYQSYEKNKTKNFKEQDKLKEEPKPAKLTFKEKPKPQNMYLC